MPSATFSNQNRGVTGVDWRALVRAEFPTGARILYFDRPNPLFVCRRAVEEGQRYYTESAAALHAVRPWRDDIEQVRVRFAAVLGSSPRQVALCDTRDAERQLRLHAGGAPVRAVDLSADFGMVRADIRPASQAVHVVSAHGVTAVHANDVSGACDVFESESCNIAGILALGGCLDVLVEIGTEVAASRVAELGERLRGALARFGMDVAAIRGRTTIVHAQRPDEMQRALDAGGVAVSAEPEGVGMSVHLFTRDDDIEGVVVALDAIRHGGRIAAVRPAHPFVCVDLNGVLDAYKGWRGARHWDPPAQGARDFLASLRGRGCRVVLFTTRYYRDAWQWLETHGLAEFIDEVTDRKPPADVFLDDHAVPFGGDYAEALRQVDRFTPHWQRSGRP